MARTLTELFAYNAWANAQMFAICLNVDQARLDERAPGTYGSVTDTLKHQVQVEVVYAAMLQDKTPSGAGSNEFFAHDLAWLADTMERTSQEYAELLASASDAYFDEPLYVPWFGFALTKHDGLLQVLTHSAQHRSQVFSVLGQHGVEIPNLDYMIFVESKQSGGA